MLDPPLGAPYKLTLGVEQSRKSHHDLNVTMTYDAKDKAGAEGEHSVSYAVTAEFRDAMARTRNTNEDGGAVDPADLMPEDDDAEDSHY